MSLTTVTFDQPAATNYIDGSAIPAGTLVQYRYRYQIGQTVYDTALSASKAQAVEIVAPTVPTDITVTPIASTNGFETVGASKTVAIPLALAPAAPADVFVTFS